MVWLLLVGCGILSGERPDEQVKEQDDEASPAQLVEPFWAPPEGIVSEVSESSEPPEVLDTASSLGHTGIVPKLPLVFDDFDNYPNGTVWGDGELVGPWRVEWDGYGTIQIDMESVLLTPAAATGPSEAHSALIVTQDQYNDVSFTVRMKNEAQLRTPTPFAWEVGQVIWNYTHHDDAYYLSLKTNGVEFGELVPPDSYVALWTADTPAMKVGNWYDIRVEQLADTSSIWINGAHVLTFVDPTPLPDGLVGLYAGDASVRFDEFTVE
jgi:hypothetical protein